MVNHRSKQIAAWLLVMALFSGILSGCSNSRAAPAKVDERLELAVKYLTEQKYDEAILAYQDVIKIDSKNVTAYKGISLAYTLQEKPDQAEQILQDGLKAIPQNPQLQLAMAGLLVDQDKGDQAEAIYEELTGNASPTLSSYQAYIYYLKQKGKLAEAISLLEQALTKNGNDYQLNAMLAELYSKNGDKDKALAALDKSITAQTDQSTAYELLAGMYKGKWADLIALGDQYIQQNQAKTGQLFKMTALYNLGSYEELISQFEKLPAEIKESAKARLIASQAYIKMNKPEQAEALVNLVKIAHLTDAGMLAGIGSYYLDAGDRENARKLALQGIGIDETVVQNYAVMYKSYVSVDEATAKIWAYKYLLKSGLGYNSAIRILANSGINLKIQNATGMSAIKQVIFSQEAIDKYKNQYNKNDMYRHSTNCYFDREKDIAYFAYVFTPTDIDEDFYGWKRTSADQVWRNVIFKFHHPRVIPVSSIPDTHNSLSLMKESAEKSGSSQAIAIPAANGTTQYRIIRIEGNNFEKDVAEAGISLDSIIFVDIQ